MQSYIKYKNSKVVFNVLGTGDPIVFLHGFLENSLMWTPIIDGLNLDKQYITIDLLGHGASETLGYVHTMEEMANVVKAVLDHLNINTVALVGHSMGGYVALAFADQFPEYLKNVVLLNSTAQADDIARIQLRLRAIDLVTKNYENFVSMSITNLFAPEIRPLIQDQIALSKAQALQTSIQGYIACAQGMLKRTCKESVLKNATFDKLIVIGEKDPVLNSMSLIEEAKRTQTPYVLLPNGHMSHIEDKEILIATLTTYFS